MPCWHKDDFPCWPLQRSSESAREFNWLLHVLNSQNKQNLWPAQGPPANGLTPSNQVKTGGRCWNQLVGNCLYLQPSSCSKRMCRKHFCIGIKKNLWSQNALVGQISSLKVTVTVGQIIIFLLCLSVFQRGKRQWPCFHNEQSETVVFLFSQQEPFSCLSFHCTVGRWAGMLLSPHPPKAWFW